MTSQSNSSAFPTRLKQRCEDLAQQYGFKANDLARGFESYLAHLFVQESGFQEVLEGQQPHSADLSEVILRRNDLGVDVVLEDSEHKQLLLVQAKWLGKGTAFPNNELQSFFGLHTKLCESDYIATGSDMARELLGGYRDRVRDHYTVRFRFVTNRVLPKTERIGLIRDSANKGYEDAGLPIVCEIFGQTELKELESQVKSTDAGILKSITFAVKGNDVVEFREPSHSLICRISGNELTDLYKQHKQELFALNIRLPMTLNRAINRDIRDTAEKEPESFFFYNNGVSAVCHEFEYNEQQNRVEAKRFQIINGAQTVGAIAGANSTDKVSVLFRLTATGDATGGEFTENIIRFNNTQNPIQISDFRANDQIQQFLREHLNRRSGKGPVPSFSYQPKRGKRITGDAGPILTSDQLARIRYSFLHGPVRTYKEPKLLFDTSDSGLYWWAFGDQGQSLQSWTEPELDEAAIAIALDDIFKKESRALRNQAKKSDAGHGHNAEGGGRAPAFGEPNYLYRLSRYLVGLVAVGLRLSREEGRFESFKELLSGKNHFDQITGSAIEDARRLVRFEINNRIETRAESQPDYNLARDERTWEKLRRQMETETLTRLH